MSPLILLLLALVLAVIVQAFLGVATPRRRWVSTGRPRIAMAKRRSVSRRSAMARRVETRQRHAEQGLEAQGNWENEGGAVATDHPVEVAAGGSRVK